LPRNVLKLQPTIAKIRAKGVTSLAGIAAELNEAVLETLRWSATRLSRARFSRSPVQFSTGADFVSPIQGFKFTVCVLNKNEPTPTRVI
jgi:hypothetical protein